MENNSIFESLCKYAEANGADPDGCRNIQEVLEAICEFKEATEYLESHTIAGAIDALTAAVEAANT